jgi:hypothetical protein
LSAWTKKRCCLFYIPSLPFPTGASWSHCRQRNGSGANRLRRNGHRAGVLPRNAAPPQRFIHENRFSPGRSTRPPRRYLHRRFSPHRPNLFPQKSFPFNPQHFHLGRLASRRLLSSKFVWRGLAADAAAWSHDCLDCQHKIHRHVHLQPLKLPILQRRFSHIHVDIVGPLQPSNGFTHLFTIIDSTSRWMEAVPLKKQPRRRAQNSCFSLGVLLWATANFDFRPWSAIYFKCVV